MAQPPDDKQAHDAHTERRNRTAAIGRDAGDIGAAAFARAGFSDPALILRWPEIAGAEVARIARPVRFSPKDGTLTLLAEPGAALFLGHESRSLAARINAWMGRPAISRIKFVQGKLTLQDALPQPPKPARAINSLDPSNAYNGPAKVKAALQSLARWRAARSLGKV
jgi:hypothetical protein